MLQLLAWLVLVAQSTADITGSNPPTGSCLCADGSVVNVRSSACGAVVDQVGSGRCFKYQGEKSTCSLDGVSYQFYKLQRGSGSGWIAGRYLKMGTASQCQNTPPAEKGNCPRIVSRAGWGARAPTSVRAINHPIPKVFIHHTVTASCTTQAACANIVRQIQTYHQKDKGWADIGYNFLVGEDGNAYKGRGWDKVGPHAKKWNLVSLGIAVIGNFMNSPPNSAALNTVKKLIACGISKGKISNSYTLHGHRDGCPTECPGNAFYNLIKTWPRYGGKLSSTC